MATKKLMMIFFNLFAIVAWLLGYVPDARAGTAFDGIVCNDYFINHKSIEPFYGQYKLDPSVLIHVREVVLAGAERTAPSRGKVLLFLHGVGAPGTVSFDLDHGNCSMMRYFAREGWDTFALDFEGIARRGVK